jgi:hypothetical protein
MAGALRAGFPIPMPYRPTLSIRVISGRLPAGAVPKTSNCGTAATARRAHSRTQTQRFTPWRSTLFESLFPALSLARTTK